MWNNYIPSRWADQPGLLFFFIVLWIDYWSLVCIKCIDSSFWWICMGASKFEIIGAGLMRRGHIANLAIMHKEQRCRYSRIAQRATFITFKVIFMHKKNLRPSKIGRYSSKESGHFQIIVKWSFGIHQHHQSQSLVPTMFGLATWILLKSQHTIFTTKDVHITEHLGRQLTVRVVVRHYPYHEEE